MSLSKKTSKIKLAQRVILSSLLAAITIVQTSITGVYADDNQNNSVASGRVKRSTLRSVGKQIDLDEEGDWFIYDHYDNDLKDSHTYAGQTVTDDQNVRSPHKFANDTNMGSNVATTAEQALMLTTTNKVFKSNRHTWILGDEGDRKMLFNGYGRPGHTDFRIFDNQNSSSIQTIAFDLDMGSIVDHAMKGFGFFVNAGISDSDKNLKAVTLFFNAKNKQIVVGTVDEKAIDIANEKSWGGPSSSVNVGTYNPNFKKRIQIEVDGTEMVVRMADYDENNVLGLYTELNSGKSITVANTGQYGFGPFVAYDSHHCSDLSYFMYDNFDLSLDYKVQVYDNNPIDASDNKLLQTTNEVKPGESISNKGASMPVQPAFDGYKFAGWNTKPDGSGTAFDANTKLDKANDDLKGIVKVYAVWSEVPSSIEFDQQTIDPNLADYIMRPTETKVATTTITPATVKNKSGEFTITDTGVATVVDNNEAITNDAKATITGVADGLTNLTFVSNLDDTKTVNATVGVDGTGPEVTASGTAVTASGTTGKVTVQVVDPKKGPAGKEFAVGVDNSSLKFIVKKASDPAPTAAEIAAGTSATVGEGGSAELNFSIVGMGEEVKVYTSVKDRLGNETVDTNGKNFTIDTTKPNIDGAATDLTYIVDETPNPLEGVTATDKDGKPLTPIVKTIKDKDGNVVTNPTAKPGRYTAEIVVTDEIGVTTTVDRNIIVYGDIEGIATGSTPAGKPIGPKALDYTDVYYTDPDGKKVPVDFKSLPVDADYDSEPNFVTPQVINPNIANVPHPAKPNVITKVKTKINIVGEANWDNSGGDNYTDGQEVYRRTTQIFTVPTFKVTQIGAPDWKVTVTVDKKAAGSTIASGVAQTYTLVATAVDPNNSNNTMVKTVYVSFKEAPVITPPINETYVLKLKNGADVEQEVNKVVDGFYRLNNYTGNQMISSHATGPRKVDATVVTEFPDTPIDTSKDYKVELCAVDNEEPDFKSAPVTITITFVEQQGLPDANDIVQRLYFIQTGEVLPYGSVEYDKQYQEMQSNIRKLPVMIHEAVMNGKFILDRYDRIGALVVDTDIHVVEGPKATTITIAQYQNAMNFIMDGGLTGPGNPQAKITNGRIPQSYAAKAFCLRNNDYRDAFEKLVSNLKVPQI